MSLKLFSWQKSAFLDTKTKFNIIPAGRRTGKTQGAERSAIIDAFNGLKVLWVDTIYSNIDRYYERYFYPDLKENDLTFNWNAQKKILKIENSYIDFRSGDRPESIEGFGYDRIYLNEAGIILNNDYLYTNAILPMLMDYKGSQLFAFGTPKGKTNKKGTEHRFWTLWQKVLNKDKNYSGVQLSSYVNPILRDEDIKILENEIGLISKEAVQQEIYAKFIDASEDKVFNHNDFDYFNLEDLSTDNIESRLGAIDVADKGTDSLSFPSGVLIADKFYITDWVFTKDDTKITIPQCSSLAKQKRLDYLAIETNNMGNIFLNQVEKEIYATTSIIPVYQSANKHTRIIQFSHFVKNFLVFRNDYEVGSDYDKAMKQLLLYTKDGKYKKDDAPDSIALLSDLLLSLFQDLFI